MEKTTNTKSVFETLSKIDVSKYIEKKNGLSYVSWAYCWHIVKEHYPKATYTIYENEQGWNYYTDGRTCWVKTGVTIEGIEHIEYLPVMDFRNASIPADKVTSFDVNKTIQRSLTKAAARHGVGLCVYAGEDLPIDAAEAEKQQPAAPAKKAAAAPAKKAYRECTMDAYNRGDLENIIEYWVSHAKPDTEQWNEVSMAIYGSAKYRWETPAFVALSQEAERRARQNA